MVILMSVLCNTDITEYRVNFRSKLKTVFRVCARDTISKSVVSQNTKTCVITIRLTDNRRDKTHSNPFYTIHIYTLPFAVTTVT